ncbi:helix-turn-helix domain-containing protein [Paenibacillus whitsoniae]|uniref:Helix-turn-helix domain-containing protein n=1 Tax=Paenibacillus whitsoniae TaxID=2496558 RepID=A0A3S0A323_9BACL|nr:helix-turn-helix domain-containing protein [Paenibacillus whitsoniae]RTE08366.1 helix-turn-helix domain-containing protein [Paenibacillus whitsoniae]
MKKKYWLQRLLLSYLPLFSTFMITLIIIFFLASAEASKKQTIRANQLFTEQASQTVDYTLRAIDQFVTGDLSTKEIWEPFFKKNGSNKYLEEFEVSQKLTQMKTSYPWIDSLYLVRLGDQTVLGNQAMSPLSDYMDREFVQQVQNNPSKMSYWTDPRLWNSFNQEPRRVLSLVRQYPLLSGELGMMVVNVRVDSIREDLTRMAGSGVSFLGLYGRNGQAIMGTDNNKNDSIDNQGTSKLLSTVKSNYTGWEMRSGLYGNGFGEYLASLSYNWIALILVAFMAGIAMIVYVSRRMYKPIETIIKRIHDSSPEKSQIWALPLKANEFIFIETAFEDLIKQSNEDSFYRKRHFFYEITEGNRSIGIEEWEHETLKFGLNHKFEIMCTGIAEIDRYTDFCKEYNIRDQGLFRFAVANVIGELAQNLNLTIWTEWISNQRIGFIIYGLEKEFETHLQAMGNKFIEWIRGNLRFTLTVSFGIAVDQLEDIYHSYQEALEGMQYKSILGNNRVITRFDISTQPKGEVYDQLPSIRSIVKAYRLGEEDWKSQLENLFDELGFGYFSRDDIIGLANYIYYHLYREMVELPIEIRKLWEDEAMPELKEAIERFETLVEFRVEFVQILSDYYERISRIRLSRSKHPIIQEVRKYIEEQFADPDLSLSYIGDQFHITTSYLSRQFKQEIGENFIDYLARVRIEKAMHLLKETTMPIQDIAAAVGYTYYISFNRVFKKLTGITPGDYRK